MISVTLNVHLILTISDTFQSIIIFSLPCASPLLCEGTRTWLFVSILQRRKDLKDTCEHQSCIFSTLYVASIIHPL